MADMIGFIGVGTMGEPMCRNLAKKSGLQVLAADRDSAPLQRLAADSVKAASLDEIVANCRTIFLSLPGGEEVKEVCLGEGGILSKVRMGWTIVDASTSPVSLARRLYAEFEGRACAFADAGAGGEVASTTLVFAPPTTSRGRAARHGERGHALRRGGAGQAVKILNNMILFQTAWRCRSVTIARANGIDGKVLYETPPRARPTSRRNHGMKAMLPGVFPERAFLADRLRAERSLLRHPGG
jgi:3-hydroxyisobutyrate dehydrogenase-like beta-hydroxyacid dehydrogenase